MRQEKPKIQKNSKPEIKSKPKRKTEVEFIPKPKTKSFDEYFQECIKNQRVPHDTPYLKKALERALKEHTVGIKHEKSALDNFAEKYVIDGRTNVMPH